MLFDLERVRANVRQATTEDLLDRVTVYRAGMEESALAIIEAELRSRDISDEEIEAHAEQRRRESNFLPDGTAVRLQLLPPPRRGRGVGLAPALGSFAGVSLLLLLLLGAPAGSRGRRLGGTGAEQNIRPRAGLHRFE